MRDPRDEQSKLWYLRQAALFQNLPAAAEARLERMAFMRRHAKGEFLFRPGEGSAKIYIVKRGGVNLFRSEEGRRIGLLNLGPGDVFGDFTFAAGAALPPDYFAQATADTMVCVAAAGDFQALAKAYPEIALRLIEELNDRLHKAHAKIHDLALSDAGTKVLRELKRRIDSRGITDSLTHEQIAQATGLSRETVTRVLGKLKAAGRLTPLPGRRYQIC